MLSRRHFLGGAALGGALGAAGLGCRCREETRPWPPVPQLGSDLGSPPRVNGRPLNVLFITIDDLNDWVGCLGGHPNASTPNIDALAKRGVLFERAYCPMPLCGPSRTSILTGIRPSNLGIYSNFDWFRDIPDLANRVTLPQMFQAHGYRTFRGGKIFHGWNGKMSDPASWDRVLGGGIGTPWPPATARFRHGLKGKFHSSSLNDHLDWSALDCKDSDTEDWRLANKAARFLGKRRRRPFFLACGFFRPHLAWYAPKKYFAKHPLAGIRPPALLPGDRGDLPKPARTIAGGADLKLLQDSGNWMAAVQAYLACCSFVDACVGRVLQGLKAGPNRRNTIIVLLSDHGYHLGEKGHIGKWTLWEESARAPLMVRAPGVTRRGGRCSAPVSLVDLYPTLAELCGLDPPGDLDGRSLGPLLQDPTRTWPWPAVTTYYYRSHSVRSQRYRYTRYKKGAEELYDHVMDPNEWYNLAARPAYTGVKQALAAHLPTSDRKPPGKKSKGS